MKFRVGVGFAMLCLLAGSRWIFDEAMHGMLSGLLQTAIHLGLIASACAVASHRETTARRVMVELGICSVFLLAVPELLFAAAGGHVADLTELLITMAVPVVVVFIVAQRSTGFGVEENPLERMLPALVGLGGAALLLPFTWPHSYAGRGWVVAMLVSVGLAGAAVERMHRALAAVGLLRAAAVVSGAAALVLGAFYRVDWTGAPAWSLSGGGIELLRCAAFDGPVLVLTVWLLREMQPVAFSARYLLVPLLTILESYFLMHAQALWTSWLGMALMAGGGFALLRSEAKNDPTPNDKAV